MFYGMNENPNQLFCLNLLYQVVLNLFKRSIIIHKVSCKNSKKLIVVFITVFLPGSWWDVSKKKCNKVWKKENKMM